MAKSTEISKQIKADILAEKLGSPGDRFMTIRELMKRYKVSLVTAKKIIDILKKEKLLISDSTNPAIINPNLEEPFAKNRLKTAEEIIGLIVTNLGNPFSRELAYEVEIFGQQAGYTVLTASSNYDSQREKEIINKFINLGITKLLIMPGIEQECVGLYNDLLHRGIKLLFLARRRDEVSADSVLVHNFQGAQEIARHFFDIGCESFGYIGQSAILKKDPRFSGYRYWIEQNNKKLFARNVIQANGWTIQDGYDAMSKLIHQFNHPHAVFCYHDFLAIGALQYCNEHHIDIPGDVAIAGFDDLPESATTLPGLTTVAYPIASMAEIAIRTILNEEQIPGRNEPLKILLQPKLIIRKSTCNQANTIITSRPQPQIEFQEI